MGMFDFIGDIVEAGLDVAIKAPGKVLEVTAETVVRLPEVGVRAVQGLADGVEKGAEKLSKAID